MRVLLVACVFLVAAVNLSLACECGLEGSSGRIYKGSKVRAHKYPWLVLIRIFPDLNSMSYEQCGGSLIDDQHIATAAHCVFNEGSLIDPGNINVYLGRVMGLSETSFPKGVSKIWVDPEFKQKDLAHDFAILTLSAPIEFTQNVSPVCLPNSDGDLSKLTTAGWGTTSASSGTNDDLLEVDVSYLDSDKCYEKMINYYVKQSGVSAAMVKQSLGGISETHMCAVNEETQGSSCAGDSGGPLMQKSDNGLTYLMGVVSGSWGACGESEDLAGLYTRISYYRDTIKSIAPNSCWKDN